MLRGAVSGSVQGRPGWCTVGGGSTLAIVGSTDVGEIARGFWATRPQRRRDDRMVAGVAAALGRRYGVDPVLLRVAFVVLTVYGGAGVLLYLLGWLLLPQQGDEASPGEALLGRGHSSTPTAGAVVLAVALIPAFFAIGFGNPSALLGLAAAAGGLYLLHRHRGGTGEPPPAPGADPSAGSAGPLEVDTSTPAAGTAPAPPTPEGTTPRQTPPGWDPLGAAPFAWDLPDPGPPSTAPARPRSRITPVTLGVALVVGGGAALAAPAVGWLGAAEVAGLALAVVGTGLVVGSFRHGGRGLIAVALPLAALTYLLQAAPVDDLRDVGERRWQATTVARLAPAYQLSVGTGHLDLTGLTVPDGGTIRTDVAVSVGEAKVFLPPELDVRVTCATGTGAVRCLGYQSSGFAAETTVADTGRDGPGGGTLVLEVRAGTGDVEVRRGR